MASRQTTPIHFEGPPTALDAEAALDIAPRLTASPEVEVGDRRYPVLLRAGRDGATFLSFALPSTTPPGRLEATVRAGDRTYPALIEVHERPAAVLEPRSLEVTGGPGSELTTKVRATNAGNVPLVLEEHQTLDVRRTGAIARGVKRAFKETQGDLVSRLIVLGEQLNSEEVQQVGVAYGARPSRLEPGESADVEVRMRIPEALASSASWAGTLPVFGASASVTLNVSRGPQHRGPARRSTGKGAEP